MSKLDIFLLDNSNKTREELSITKPKNYQELLKKLNQKYQNISNYDLFIFDDKNNEMKITDESDYKILDNILLIREKKRDNLDESIFAINYDKLSESKQDILDEKYNCIICSNRIKKENPFLCYKCQKIFHEKCLKDWEQKCKLQNKKLTCPNCRNELALEKWNKKINHEENRKEEGNLINKINELNEKILKQNELIKKYEKYFKKKEEEKKNKEFIKPVSIHGTHTILDQMINCVCKIEIKNKEGTGFFCRIKYEENETYVFMTSYQILDENYYHENDTLTLIIGGSDKYGRYIVLDLKIKRRTYFSKKYDLTIIELYKDDNIYNFLELDDNLLDKEINDCYKDLSIYIPHYSSEDSSIVSYGLLKGINNYEIKHTCCIENSSSGSPILNLSNNKIIGMHIQNVVNKNYNLGIFLKYPYKEFLENNKIKKNLIPYNYYFYKLKSRIEIFYMKLNDRINGYAIYPNKPGPKKSVIFRTTQDDTEILTLNYGTEIGKMLKIYLRRIGRYDLIDSNRNQVCFLYNGFQLKFGDKTPIEIFFKNNNNPKVIVNLVPNNYHYFDWDLLELEKPEKDLIASYISVVHKHIRPPSPEMKNENIENIEKEITIKFNNRGNIIQIKMDASSMVAELINEYFEKTKLKKGTFKFNGNILNPMDVTLLGEAGFKNNSEITVE